MWRQLQTPFFTVLFIFAFFYLFAKLFGPLPFSVNSVTTTKTDLFTVSGEGEVTAVPDTAQFSVGVTKTAASVETAKQQVNETVNKILADLKRLGIPEKNIKTTNFSVNPNYDFDVPVPDGSNKISGYTVSQNLQVTADSVDIANKALDAATASGANQIYGVTFTLDDKEREKLEDQARKQAIDKAKKKAQSIANAAGIRLGRIVNIQESSDGQPPIFLQREALDKAGTGGEPTQLQPGENTVRVTVTLSYETL